MWIEFVIIGAIAYCIYIITKPSIDYWGRYGVHRIHDSTMVEKAMVFFGIKYTFGDLDEVAYRRIGEDKVAGTVENGQPLLIVKDMDTVKKILIKDFDHFLDRRPFLTNDKQDVFNKVLFNLSGDEWKNVRNSVSPTFTTGKIRRMMEYFNKVAHEWTQHLKDEIKKQGGTNGVTIIVQDEATHYTTDVIASTVFGMDAGTIKNPNAEFSRMVQKLNSTKFLDIVKFAFANAFPKLINVLKLDIIDDEALKFLERILGQAMKERMDGKVKRNDFLQLIAEARKGELKGEGADELSTFEKDAELAGDVKKNALVDDKIATAQLIQFFFAGFSTVSNFLQFSMYVLALYPDVQTKLREEVDKNLFKKGEDLDYDEVNQLTYLDMFVCEVLRKFPVINRLERKCVKDYRSPDNFTIPKGAMISIPVQAIHHDPKYYQRPYDFYPEHFSPDMKTKRDPYAFLAFGNGPRNCIGMRFALVEGKAALAHLVHNFELLPAPTTPIPLQQRPLAAFGQPPDDLQLVIKLVK